MNNFTQWLFSQNNFEQIIITFGIIAFGVIFTTLLATQTFKLLLKKYVGQEKVSIKMLGDDGDFPSTHTAVYVSSAVQIGFLLLFTCNLSSVIRMNILATSILVAIGIPMCYHIRDAFGYRHRADNTNQNIRDLAEEYSNHSINNRISANFTILFDRIVKESQKRVGHLKPEVLGGIVSGIIGALYPICLFIDIRLIWLCIALSLIYYTTMLILLKKAKEKQR